MSWAARKWWKRQTALPSMPAALLFHIADEADDKGQCWPSQATLARRTAWSKPTIKRWTDVLRALDLVSTKKRFNHHKGYCDAMLYTVHLDRVVTSDEVQRQIKPGAICLPEGKSNLVTGQIKPGGKHPQSPHHEHEGAGAPQARWPAPAPHHESDHDHEARSRSLGGSATAPAPLSPTMSAAADGVAQPLAGARHEHEADQDYERVLIEVAASFRIQLRKLGVQPKMIEAIEAEASRHHRELLDGSEQAVRCSTLQLVVEMVEEGKPPNVALDRLRTAREVASMFGRDLVNYWVDRLSKLGSYTKAIDERVRRLIVLVEAVEADARDDALDGVAGLLEAVFDDLEIGASEAQMIKALQWHIEFEEERAEEAADEEPPPPKLKANGRGNGHARPR